MGDADPKVLVRNHVNIVFHGHDHFFSRQELDGVEYQLVPQPGHPGSPRSKDTEAQYGYTSGVSLPGSGHLLVRVSDSGVAVEYIRAALPGEEDIGTKNGQIAYRYELPAGQQASRGGGSTGS